MKNTRTEEQVAELPVPQPDEADVVITDDFDHEVCSEPGFDSSSSDEDEENEDEEEQSLSAEPVAEPHNFPGTSAANIKRNSKEVVRNDRVKAKVKTAGRLGTVKRKSSGNKDSYKGAQNELSTANNPSSGRQNCNCRTTTNAQSGNQADAVLGARENLDQLGYQPENKGPCGRVRFINEGNSGLKVESAFPRPSIFFNSFSQMPFFFRSYSGQTSMLLMIKWESTIGKEAGLRK